ncbi:MAG: hypothetical protein OWQ54_06060 [Sulfolobaceae archaeon]|nr:hypothetical protein [Sulfolobaceae archaeon]
MLSKQDILSHYSNELVREEIFNFAKSRWIALFSQTMIRYDKDGKPLKFDKPEDVPKLVLQYNVRTIYATAAKYKVLQNKNDVDNGANIFAYTPFFDIDTSLQKWEYAIKAADIIVSALEKEGVYKSVYLLWSGEGIHVRINENAIPEKMDPIVASSAIVKYIIRKVKGELEEIAKSSGGILKVEDLIDSKRVFTAPLSFHKNVDLVTVCFSPSDLHNFTPDWANPKNFRHSKGLYEVYEKDEAEDLVIKAISELSIPIAKHEKVSYSTQQAPQTQELGRFQVMGLLQAARYYVLYGDMDKAKSFGLNRAIFYAWAKYYGKGYSARKGKIDYEAKKGIGKEESKELVNVAGEEVFLDKKSGLFEIGDKSQTPEDYDKEIKDKIQLIINYDVAWNSAVKYVSSFPRNVLLDQRQFYQKVYLPVRDVFIEKVVKGKKSGLEAYFT